MTCSLGFVKSSIWALSGPGPAGCFSLDGGSGFPVSLAAGAVAGTSYCCPLPLRGWLLAQTRWGARSGQACCALFVALLPGTVCREPSDPAWLTCSLASRPGPVWGLSGGCCVGCDPDTGQARARVWLAAEQSLAVAGCPLSLSLLSLRAQGTFCLMPVTLLCGLLSLSLCWSLLGWFVGPRSPESCTWMAVRAFHTRRPVSGCEALGSAPFP